ncbi:MAG TPA: glycosyltransferase [Gammaproteobacteria bacterium]|nr:glycosyltransferase [Gammaproteobacteria bacterium]
MSFKACAVVPVFNHHTCLERIVAALAAAGLPVILVDDGSDAPTREVLAALAERPDVECLTLPRNQGKGAAVMAGIGRAGERGFTHALQIDADGQHDLDDIPRLLALAAAHPDHLVSGEPRYDESVPAVRFYGRYLTHALIWLDTLSLSLRDSMCGFRVYPVAPSLALARRVRIGRRMDFDTDIMARLYWAGTESLFVPTRVCYPADGTSHFRMFADNRRMISLHLRLFAGLWPRIPTLLRRHFARRRSAHWARIAERGSLAGIRFVGFVDRACGRTVSRLLLAPVIAYFLVAHPRARRASRQFLAAAGVRPSFGNRFRQLANFSVSILDKVRAWQAPERIEMDFSDCGALLDDVRARRGALLITAHMGNTEATRALACRQPDLRITALVHTHNSVIVNAMLREANADYPSRLLQVRDVGPDTALMLRDRIQSGEIVVIAGDRTPVDEHSPTATVDFLGRPARFAIGPYVLAHALECPVYLFFCVRQGRGYKVCMERFADRIRLPRASRQSAVEEWAARYAERLGDYARRFPLQWYNFYDLWAGGDEAQPARHEARHEERTA